MAISDTNRPISATSGGQIRPVDTSQYIYAGEVSRGDRANSADAFLTNTFLAGPPDTTADGSGWMDTPAYTRTNNAAGFQAWLQTPEGQSAIGRANQKFGPGQQRIDLSANGAGNGFSSLSPGALGGDLWSSLKDNDWNAILKGTAFVAGAGMAGNAGMIPGVPGTASAAGTAGASGADYIGSSMTTAGADGMTVLGTSSQAGVYNAAGQGLTWDAVGNVVANGTVGPGGAALTAGAGTGAAGSTPGLFGTEITGTQALSAGGIAATAANAFGPQGGPATDALNMGNDYSGYNPSDPIGVQNPANNPLSTGGYDDPITGQPIPYGSAGDGTPTGSPSWLDKLFGNASTLKSLFPNMDLGNLASAGANYAASNSIADKYIQAAKDLQKSGNPLNDPQRQPYQAQFQDLLSNPSSFYDKNPALQGGLGTAREALQGSLGTSREALSGSLASSKEALQGGLDNANRVYGTADRAAQLGDPLQNPTRMPWNEQLKSLEANPSAFWETNPVAQGQLNLANNMFQANSAKMGTGGTQFSNYLKNVTNIASNTFNDQAKLLSGLAGYDAPNTSASAYTTTIGNAGGLAGDAYNKYGTNTNAAYTNFGTTSGDAYKNFGTNTGNAYTSAGKDYQTQLGTVGQAGGFTLPAQGTNATADLLKQGIGAQNTGLVGIGNLFGQTANA